MYSSGVKKYCLSFMVWSGSKILNRSRAALSWFVSDVSDSSYSQIMNCEPRLALILLGSVFVDLSNFVLIANFIYHSLSLLLRKANNLLPLSIFIISTGLTSPRCGLGVFSQSNTFSFFQPVSLLTLLNASLYISRCDFISSL